ncbi:VCBS domain-containing protein [Aeromonas sp. 164P]
MTEGSPGNPVKEDILIRGSAYSQTSGKLQVTDTDQGENHFNAEFNGVSDSGYGGFFLAPTGAWIYRLDNNNPAVQALGEGQPLTDTFTVQSVDGTTHTVTVTIIGTNDAPTVTAVDTAHAANLGAVFAGASQTFTEAQLLALLHAADVDHDTLSISAVAIDPAVGSFTRATNGDWTFHPAGSAHGTNLPVTLTVTDGTATITAQAAVEVKAVLTGDIAGSVTEDTATVITGDLHDGSGATLHLGDHLMHGSFGSLDLRDQGHWSYTLDNTNTAVQRLKDGETRTETFTITGPGGQPQDITITITGTHDQPVISVPSAAPQTIGGITQTQGIDGADVHLLDSAFATSHTGVPVGTHIVGLYLPGDSHNLLANIAPGDLPTVHDGYNTGNLAAAGAGYQYLSQHQWFGQHLDGGTARYAAVAPSVRNNFDGGIVVFSDGTVGRLVKVCDDNSPSGPGDYLYFNKFDGVNAQQGLTTLSGTGNAGSQVEVFEGSTSLGHATVDAQGHWTYVLPQALADGDHALHTVSGGVTSAVVHAVVQHGAASLSLEAPMLGTATEDDAAHTSLSGQMSVTDIDHDDHPVFTAQAHTAGTYGTFSVDTQGHWTYTLDNSNPQVQALGATDHRTETFTVEVTTDSGERVTQTVQVTVAGTNDAPIVTTMDAVHAADLGDLNPGASQTYTQTQLLALVHATDVEHDTLSISAVTIDPAYGGFTREANGDWTFHPAAGAAGNQLPVTLTVTDGTARITARGALTLEAPGTLSIDSIDNSLAVQTASTGGHHVHGSTNPGGQTHWASNAYQVTSGAVTIHGSATGVPDGATVTVHLADKLNPANSFDLTATASGGLWTVTVPAAQIDKVGNHDWAVDVSATDKFGATVHTTTEIIDEGSLKLTATEGGAAASLDLLDGADGMAVANLLYSTDGQHYTSQIPAGYKLGADGHTLQVDPTNPAFDNLAAGATQTLKVKYDITETVGGVAQTVHQTGSVTLTGTNDAPVVTAQTQTATEDGAVLHDRFTATDADGDTLSYSTTAKVDGFTLNADGSYSFDPSHASYQHLAAGATQAINIPITVSDGHGGTTTQNLQITLTGTDDAPVIGAAAGAMVASTTEETSSGNALEQMGVALQQDSKLSDLGSTLLWAIGSPKMQDAFPGDSSLNDMIYGQNAPDARNLWVHSDFDILLTGPAGTPPQTLHGASRDTADAQLGTLIDWVKQGAGYSVEFLRAPGAQGGFFLANDPHVDRGQTAFQWLGSTIADGYYGSSSAEDFKHAIDDAHYHFAPRVVAAAAEVTHGDVTEDSAATVTGTLHAHDVDDRDTPTFTVEGGGHGQYGDFHIDSQTGAWTYTLNANAQGLSATDAPTETFTVLVTDASGQSARQVMTMTVHGQNDVSVITGEQTGTVSEDNPATASGTLRINDADTADTPAFVAHDASRPIQGTYGSMTLDAQGHWVYTLDSSRPAVQALNTGTPVTDHLTVRGADGATATIAITISGSNDAPVLSEIGVLRATAADTPQTYQVAHLLEHTTDVDDKTGLQVQNIHADPAQGTVVMSADGRSFTFTPAAGFHGVANLHYDLVDAHGGIGQGEARLGVGQSAGTVTLDYGVTTSGPAQLAAAVNDGTTILIKPAELVSTSTDRDGDSLSVPVAEMHVDHGTISGTDSLGNLLYTPEPGYAGPVVFSYRVSDTDHLSPNAQSVGATATLQLTRPADNAPTVTADTLHPADLGATVEDTAKTFTEADLLKLVGAADPDAVWGDTLHIGAVSIDPAVGSFSKLANGDWTFTPAADFSGSHLPVTVEVTDGQLTTTAHAALDVTPVADMPTLSLSLGATPLAPQQDPGGTQISDSGDLTQTYLGTFYSPQGWMLPHFTAVGFVTGDMDPSLVTGIQLDGQDIGGTLTVVDTGTEGRAVQITGIDAPRVQAILTDIHNGHPLTFTFAQGAPAHSVWHIVAQQNSGNFGPPGGWVGPNVNPGFDSDFGVERPVTTTPASSYLAANVDEDSHVPLNIQIGSPDADGSETFVVTIAGLPAGATLSAGTHNPDDTWTLTQPQLSGLQLTPAADWSGEMRLHVTATSTDGTDTASTTSELRLNVAAIAETPTLSSGGDIAVDEDHGPMALGIALNLHVDPSETASISITGVPADASLSAGTRNADGSWTLAPADLPGLALTPGANYAGTMTLGVTATSTEQGERPR